MKNCHAGDELAAAESAIFARKSLSFTAAAAAGLPGQFETFQFGGLRVAIATASEFDFLNSVDGITDESVGFLPEILTRFKNPQATTLVAVSPAKRLTDTLEGLGYEPVGVQPIAYLRPDSASSPVKTDIGKWRVTEVSTEEDSACFLNLLNAGYAVTGPVGALIRSEHALSTIRGFIAWRNTEPLAAAAMSLHTTGVVFGGASTLPVARGAGAQSALLAHRLRLIKVLGVSLAAATAAPRSPSVRNLARSGFTIVERTA